MALAIELMIVVIEYMAYAHIKKGKMCAYMIKPRMELISPKARVYSIPVPSEKLTILFGLK